MTPLERLLAEELPTGTFGDARPPHTDEPRLSHITDQQATANRRALEEALGITPKRRRHLRAVPENATRRAA